MPVETLRVTLNSSLAAPSQARDALAGWLDGIGVDGQARSDLLIVVSELVTNAVLHAASAPEVVASFDDGRIRLEVHDSEFAPPIERTADGDDLGGWGLRFVRTMTDGWGWMPTATGKVVWTETLR